MAGETTGNATSNKEKVTLTVSPSGLRRIDGARGLINRSAFFELGASLLADLLEQDKRIASAILKIPRERVREAMAAALSEAEESP